MCGDEGLSATTEPDSGATYDAYYFGHECGRPYERNPYWLGFFGDMAEKIVERIAPGSALDAGCAMGFLVEALRDRGVDAWGVDISPYAIEQVTAAVKPYCWVGSVTDPPPRRYDLIVCIEVLEHLEPADADRAVEVFCAHTEDVLFSSSPSDFREATHRSVRPAEAWAELFARQGFFRDLDFDASFVTPWAVRYRRRSDPLGRLVSEYERSTARLIEENRALRHVTVEQRDQLAHATSALEAERASRAPEREEAERRRTQLEQSEALSGRLRAATTSFLFALGSSRSPLAATAQERGGANVPFTATGVAGALNVQESGHSLWFLAGAGDAVRLEAALAPGRYWVRARAMAARDTDLELEVGSETHRLATLGPRLADLATPVVVTEAASELRLRLEHAVDVAVLGDVHVVRDRGHGEPRREVRDLLAPLTRRAPRAARGLRRRVRRLRARREPDAPESQPTGEHDAWMRERLRARGHLYPTTPGPGLVSLLTLVWNTEALYLQALADSVLGQDVDDWEWVVLDNGSTRAGTAAVLAELARDPRVRLIRSEENLGIVGGLRRCLEQATGRYAATVDHDDLLAPDAVRVLAWHIRAAGGPPLLYSDEDKIDGDRRSEPYFKPGWDPVLFLNSAYIAHLGAVDRELALELGCYTDRAAEGSHDWDTFLRFVLAGHTPVHVPEILYSWRLHEGSTAMNIDSKSFIHSSQQHVLGRFLVAQKHPDRFRSEQSPLVSGTPDWWFKRSRVQPRPLLSLVLGGDQGSADTLLRATGYPSQEARAVPVDLQPRELLNAAKKLAEQDGLVHFVLHGIAPDGDEWPWEVLTLTELHPDVVMVGGRVTDGRGTVVAAGEYFGVGGDCGCPDVGRSLDDSGYVMQMWKQRSVDAVSTAFAVLEARFLEKFLQANRQEGMSLALLGAWLGAHARETGRRVVYSPYLLGRGTWSSEQLSALVASGERARFAERHRDLLAGTPLFPPLLSRDPARAYRPVDPWVGVAGGSVPTSGSFAATNRSEGPYTDGSMGDSTRSRKPASANARRSSSG